MAGRLERVLALLESEGEKLLAEWLRGVVEEDVPQHRRAVEEGELRAESQALLERFREALRSGELETIDSEGWASVREVVEDICKKRARRGVAPSETASFILALKRPLFLRLLDGASRDTEAIDQLWRATRLIDKLSLYANDVYLRAREEVISRQQEELLELSTPVVTLWKGVLALPLIGTLDSSRTQVVMEKLLERIASSGSEIAIIDITGVPTVDTLVAQHLLKAVAAIRLMGAECVISGIRPQIAQTIVHLGVDLGDVVTKSTIADGFAYALERLGAAPPSEITTPTT